MPSGRSKLEALREKSRRQDQRRKSRREREVELFKKMMSSKSDDTTSHKDSTFGPGVSYSKGSGTKLFSGPKFLLVLGIINLDHLSSMLVLLA